MELKKGYKRTEVGVIPIHWSLEKFGNLITDKKGGASIKPSQFSDSGISVIPKGGVVRGGFLKIEKKDIQYCPIEFLSSHKSNCVDQNFLVVVLRDLVPSGPNLGLIIKIPVRDNYILAQGTYGFRTISNKCNKSYLVHYSNSDSYRILMQKNMVGSTQVFIRSSRLWELEIPLPPLPEQKAIAQVLSDTDALIQALQEKINKKRAIKQGAMQQLLKPKEGWEKKKLGEIAIIKGGGTPSSFNSNFWNGNIDWFTPTEIGKSKYVSTSKRKITDDGLSNSSAQILPIGTVLLTSRAGIGDIAITTKLVCTNQGFQSLIPDDDTDTEFLYYIVGTLKNEFLSKASGSTFLEISPNNLKSIDVSIPHKDEQKIIATILSDMDKEIEQLEEKLAKYKNIKQGLMQILLTGKIRLV